MTIQPTPSTPEVIPTPWTIIIVAALGYFVDIYDLILFGIVRTSSLMDLGYSGEALTTEGIFLLNVQMVGLLLGGILWGVLGDRKGRLSVLFGSIIMYSLANLANGFVTNIEQYAVLRFIAGIGLAGELGAGVTLVMESMAKEKRGIGAAIIASFGVLGAIVAAAMGELTDWRTAYIFGGIMGLALLVLRLKTFESSIFTSMLDESVQRGAMHMLFNNKVRFRKYMLCILVGVPIWFVIGLLGILSPEFSQVLGVQGTVKASMSILFLYAGLALGDIMSGVVSQLLQSRRTAMMAFITSLLILIWLYLHADGVTLAQFYGLCFALGVAGGYWALFVTNAAEQFGTNLRATVTTTAPNFVRGALVPMTMAFQSLSQHYGLIQAAMIIGTLVSLVALWAAYVMEETFFKDLRCVER